MESILAIGMDPHTQITTPCKKNLVFGLLTFNRKKLSIELLHQHSVVDTPTQSFIVKDVIRGHHSTKTLSLSPSLFLSLSVKIGNSKCTRNPNLFLQPTERCCRSIGMIGYNCSTGKHHLIATVAKGLERGAREKEARKGGRNKTEVG